MRQVPAFAEEARVMMSRPRRAGWPGILCILMLSLAAPSVLAAPPFFGMPPTERQSLVQPQGLVQPPGLSAEQAAGVVHRYTGGRVLSTTPAQRGGADGYDVRVLVDGKRVRNVFVDQQGNIRNQR